MNIIYLYKLQSCIQATLDGQQALAKQSTQFQFMQSHSALVFFIFSLRRLVLLTALSEKKKKTLEVLAGSRELYIYKSGVSLVGLFGLFQFFSVH